MLETSYEEGQFPSLLTGPTFKIGGWHQGQKDKMLVVEPLVAPPKLLYGPPAVTEYLLTHLCAFPPNSLHQCVFFKGQSSWHRSSLPCMGREPEVPRRLYPSSHHRESLSINVNT